jgi:hypothetical protein
MYRFVSGAIYPNREAFAEAALDTDAIEPVTKEDRK